MKKILLSALFTILFAIFSYAQTPCTRHVETTGGFSYCPPAGWVVKDSASGPYKSFFTQDSDAVRANFNVKDEKSSLSNDEYMASALRYMLDKNEERGAEARKVVGWTQFTTDSKLKGSRMIYETLYKGYNLRTVQYVLDFPGRKVLITGTSLGSDKDLVDKVFDSVARSLKVNP